MQLAAITEWFSKARHQVRAFVYSRSGDEWKEYFISRLGAVRAYAQGNGEKAAGIGFLLGIFLVFFFKIFVVSVVIATLAVITIIIWADSRPQDWQG